MPARGAFSAKRKKFLESKRADFAAAVENNDTADSLAVIFRQFFKRFPIDLDDDKEPSDEALAAVDDGAPDPEVEEPSESLGTEEYAAALAASSDRQRRIQAKRDQITRWFSYRYSKEHNTDPRSNDPKNPYNSLLLQLTGSLVSAKPRRKAPFNIWVRDKCSTQPIKDEVERILDGRLPDTKKMVVIRSEAARAAFKRLPDVEQEKWKLAADAEHREALKEHEKACKGVVSTNPEDRQRAINNLVRFVQPILDRIAAVTGFKVLLLAGGPEPARQGRLSLISMHSGTTGGDVPLNFGQAERVAYKQYIMPIWGRFMRACFTPDECRSRALPSSSVEDTLQSFTGGEEGASFHSFDIPELMSSAAPVHVPSSTADHRLPQPSTPSGIAGLTEAIRDVSRRIEESIARSIAGSISPTSSFVPSPLPSAPPSPVPAAPKRTRSLSNADPSPKRVRASSPVVSPAMEPPRNAPEWVSNAVTMFSSEPLNGKWKELVAAWLVYEERRNFNGPKLSPKGRPKVVADWMKWARKPKWRPSTFPKVDAFARQHTLWWQSLQPAWRVVDRNGMMSRTVEGSWGSLHVGGINGLLSALASLFFWGLAIRNANGSPDSWNTVVDDTLFVIQQLTIDL